MVIWRTSVRSRWQVQPFLHTAESAARVGARLVNQFYGEAQSLPVVVLPDVESAEVDE